MTDSFWTGGPGAYKRDLREHYDSRLRDLRARCEQCLDEKSRTELECQLSTLEAEYQSKLETIDKLLF